MNQFTWTYIGDSGYSEIVGLYHSSKSGHLMIYVGKKVIVVDFNVRDSKSYSFFINEELCEVRLERKDLKMFYYFEINKEANTPRNKARKNTEKKHFKQSIVFFGIGILAVVLLAFYFNHTLKEQKATEEILQYPEQAIGKINFEKKEDQAVISYFYVVDNQSYSGKSNFEKVNQTLHSNGFPVESGDEFMVEYATQDPEVSRIHFERPSKKQIQIYLAKTLEKHLEFHPEMTKKMAVCQLQIAYELRGLRALTDFYFQKELPENNPYHNRITYRRLTRGLEFQRKVEQKCW